MLRAKKKITKKDLKRDNLINAYAKFSAFYYAHRNILNYITLAIIVIVAGSYIYIKYQSDNNKRANHELAKVLPLFDAGNQDIENYRAAIEGQPERGIMGLKNIVDKYSGTSSGQLAVFYLANAYYWLGQFDDALQYFNAFKGGEKEIKASALAGIAACYEANNRYSEAGNFYEKAAKVSINKSYIPEYLRQAGKCYALAGDREKVFSIANIIKREFPHTNTAREIDRYLAQVSS